MVATLCEYPLLNSLWCSYHPTCNRLDYHNGVTTASQLRAVNVSCKECLRRLAQVRQMRWRKAQLFKMKQSFISPSVSLLLLVLVPRFQRCDISCLNLVWNLGSCTHWQGTYRSFVISSFIFFSFLIFLIFYQGEIPLFVNIESADIMVALANLKREIEDTKRNPLKLIFSGTTEAHLLAEEIENLMLVRDFSKYFSILLRAETNVSFYFLFSVVRSRQTLLFFWERETYICWINLDYRVLHFLNVVLLRNWWMKVSMYLSASRCRSHSSEHSIWSCLGKSFLSLQSRTQSFLMAQSTNLRLPSNLKELLINPMLLHSYFPISNERAWAWDPVKLLWYISVFSWFGTQILRPTPNPFCLQLYKLDRRTELSIQSSYPIPSHND